MYQSTTYMNALRFLMLTLLIIFSKKASYVPVARYQAMDL